MNPSHSTTPDMRIFIGSQSNPHFLGFLSEQMFEQRDLTQAHNGDILVTTEPIDQLYLDYWHNHLKYSLPTMITAGPFEPTKVLSDLIIGKPDIQDKIKSSINGASPRLEFFTPMPSEEVLVEHLGLPAYTNFDFAKEMQKKLVFKKLCEEIGISTLPYIALDPSVTWEQVIDSLGVNRDGYIAKHIYGTGGAGLGTIIPLKSENDFLNLKGSENYIIERMIVVSMEICVHWEIDFNGQVHFKNKFEQLAENVSYVGTIFPTEIPKNLWDKIWNEYLVLTQKIAELKGLGFMCCDILVDEHGKFYWSDLNPRKGAILFIHDAVSRFLKNHDMTEVPHFVRHKHNKAKVKSFNELKQTLGDMLNLTENGIVIVTNPGVIEYGMVDLTAISFLSHEHAFCILDEAINVIK